MKINGKWYFNETPKVDLEKIIYQDITFVFNDDNGEVINGYNMTIDSGEIYVRIASDPLYIYADKRWADEAYRTIDFGAAYQEVSDDFYNWLTANAVQLSKPIPMTHPKGIKLLTKGHKLSKDLEVVPTFDITEVETVDIRIDDETAGNIFLLVVKDGKVKLRTSEDHDAEYKAVKDSFAYFACDSSASVTYYNEAFTAQPEAQFDDGSSKTTIFKVSESGVMAISI